LRRIGAGRYTLFLSLTTTPSAARRRVVWGPGPVWTL